MGKPFVKQISLIQIDGAYVKRGANVLPALCNLHPMICLQTDTSSLKDKEFFKRHIGFGGNKIRDSGLLWPTCYPASVAKNMLFWALKIEIAFKI